MPLTSDEAAAQTRLVHACEHYAEDPRKYARIITEINAGYGCGRSVLLPYFEKSWKTLSVEVKKLLIDLLKVSIDSSSQNSIFYSFKDDLDDWLILIEAEPELAKGRFYSGTNTVYANFLSWGSIEQINKLISLVDPLLIDEDGYNIRMKAEYCRGRKLALILAGNELAAVKKIINSENVKDQELVDKVISNLAPQYFTDLLLPLYEEETTSERIKKHILSLIPTAYNNCNSVETAQILRKKFPDLNLIYQPVNDHGQTLVEKAAASGDIISVEQELDLICKNYNNHQDHSQKIIKRLTTKYTSVIATYYAKNKDTISPELIEYIVKEIVSEYQICSISDAMKLSKLCPELANIACGPNRRPIIFYAILHYSLEHVKELVEKAKPDLSVEENLLIPSQFAAQNSRPEMVDFLIEAELEQACLNYENDKTKYGKAIEKLAQDNLMSKIIPFYISNKSNLKPSLAKYFEELIEFMYRGIKNISQAEQILAHFPNFLNIPMNDRSDHILVAAAKQGNLKLVEKLIAAGADVFKFGHQGMSARQHAESHGHSGVARLLAEKELEYACANYENFPAYYYAKIEDLAERYFHSLLWPHFLSNRTAPIANDLKLIFKKQIEQDKFRSETILLIVREIPELANTITNGQSLIHNFSAYVKLEQLTELIAHGADIFKLDPQGRSPRMCAEAWQNHENANYLARKEVEAAHKLFDSAKQSDIDRAKEIISGLIPKYFNVLADYCQQLNSTVKFKRYIDYRVKIFYNNCDSLTIANNLATQFPEMRQLLINQPINSHNQTLAMKAAQEKSYSLLYELINSNADLYKVDNFGKTVFSYLDFKNIKAVNADKIKFVSAGLDYAFNNILIDKVSAEQQITNISANNFNSIIIPYYKNVMNKVIPVPRGFTEQTFKEYVKKLAEQYLLIQEDKHIYSISFYSNLINLSALFPELINLNLSEKFKLTILIVAAKAGIVAYVKEILKFNPDVFCRDYQGKTARDYAEEYSGHEIANLIADKELEVAVERELPNVATSIFANSKYRNKLSNTLIMALRGNKQDFIVNVLSHDLASLSELENFNQYAIDHKLLLTPLTRNALVIAQLKKLDELYYSQLNIFSSKRVKQEYIERSMALIKTLDDSFKRTAYLLCANSKTAKYLKFNILRDSSTSTQTFEVEAGLSQSIDDFQSLKSTLDKLDNIIYERMRSWRAFFSKSYTKELKDRYLDKAIELIRNSNISLADKIEATKIAATSRSATHCRFLRWSNDKDTMTSVYTRMGVKQDSNGVAESVYLNSQANVIHVTNQVNPSNVPITLASGPSFIGENYVLPRQVQSTPHYYTQNRSSNYAPQVYSANRSDTEDTIDHQAYKNAAPKSVAKQDPRQMLLA